MMLANHNLFAQTDPLPVHCGVSNNNESLQPENTNAEQCVPPYTVSAQPFLPLQSVRPIKIHVNCIVLQKPGADPGNFQNIPEHMASLNQWIAKCNTTLNNLNGTSDSSATLPVENWREGIYVFVLYQDGKATARQRVVIQH